jgi:hypothetical protein
LHQLMRSSHNGMVSVPSFCPSSFLFMYMLKLSFAAVICFFFFKEKKKLFRFQVLTEEFSCRKGSWTGPRSQNTWLEKSLESKINFLALYLNWILVFLPLNYSYCFQVHYHEYFDWLLEMLMICLHVTYSYGYDPFGLSKKPEDFAKYVQLSLWLLSFFLKHVDFCWWRLHFLLQISGIWVDSRQVGWHDQRVDALSQVKECHSNK